MLHNRKANPAELLGLVFRLRILDIALQADPTYYLAIAVMLLTVLLLAR
jgi:hypothetical protein